jgi:hypothetical protein
MRMVDGLAALKPRHPERTLRFNQRNVKVEGLIADNRVLHESLMKVAPHQKVKS